MQYFEATFTITPCSQDACDILAALVAEAGFESFEYTDDGMNGYVQQQLFDRDALQQAVDSFPLPATSISYTIGEAEYRDWNEQWEQEGFEPIVIDNLVIHDGRHLPADNGQGGSDNDRISIEIDAHQAFGTGTHETTRMICRQLLGMHIGGKRVLDAGCGTGILGICALKLGAAECVAYDIDEWSVDNTRHNAVINHVDQRLQPIHGDASVLDSAVDGTFDIVTANINRNILLADMPRFVQKMHKGSTLILSGFYGDDCPLLCEKASSLGLSLTAQQSDADWHMLVFQL
ncbi:MAG: 50S ribosomal protein L11 methyltransferase [Prevotella sp.]|nr:50S ribosomal protein L11 methyltransferase [Prevotella sp.]